MTRLLKFAPALASILVALAGVVSLAQVLTITVHHHRFGHIDDSLLPFTAAQNSRLFIVGIGLLQLYLSTQIYRRKYMAYQLVSLGLGLLIAVELLISKNTAQLAFYGLTLALLAVSRSQYTVTSDNLSLRRGAMVAGAIILVVFAYATIGFSRLSEREVGTRLSVPSAMKYAAREVFTFQEYELPLRTASARIFVLSVNTAAVTAYGLAIFTLFRPLRFQYGASRHERELAREILMHGSTSTEDFFKLWPLDKHYFFNSAQDSFIAYKVIAGDALVLDGPSGNTESFAALLTHFADFCHRNGWAPAFINATEELDCYTGKGSYQRIFIGNEAAINVEKFAAETYRSKHFRYIKNRAERDGIGFEYWSAPLSPEQIQTLKQVSDGWLSQRGRREYTFALGYFDAEYIKNSDAAVLTQNGKVVAYANVLPSFQPEARTIDHMRYTAHMPQTGMHFLLMQLILRLHEAGVQHFNLGLAPLSGIESREAGNLPERLLAVLKKLGSRYYSFGGLEQFKNKFEPEWQARYMYYEGTPARLLRVATSLSRAVNVPVAGRLRRTVLISMSVIAAICYNTFPLAFLLNPRKALHGLASELGASGQAYAAFFNTIDILSSLLIFIIIWLLWNEQGTSSRRYHRILILFGATAVGNLLAAVTPLPLHASSAVQFTLHDIFSAINILGIVFAAPLLLTTPIGRKRLLWALYAVLVVSLALSAIYEGHIVGSLSQRVQIITSGIWFIIITARLSKLGIPPHQTK